MDQDHQVSHPPAADGCANCGHPVIENGYPTPLCKDCREKFIKFPIPIWIKIFAGVVGIILIIAMINLPKNFLAGVHLQRGKNAEKVNQYLTAQNEFEKVVKEIPDLVEAKSHLMVASFYNQDFETFIKMSDKLKGEKIEDEDMYSQLNELVQKANNYFPSDSCTNLASNYHSFDSIPGTIYESYIETHPDELFPAIRYASFLFDNKEYNQCDSILNLILQKDADYISALSMKTSVKRELSQFDSSYYYSDRMLLLNKESSFGMSTKARTFLKEKKDSEGLQWALKSYNIDSKNPYSKATLALAYHFNKKTSERDKLIEGSKKDSTEIIYMQYVIDIIEGREKFRDQ